MSSLTPTLVQELKPVQLEYLAILEVSTEDFVTPPT